MNPEVDQQIVVEANVQRKQFWSVETVSGIIDAHLQEVIPHIDRPDSIIVVNLEGARWFAWQLLYRAAQVTGNDRSDQARYVKVTSATGQATHGEPRIEQWFANPREVEGKYVFVPEDINDNGLTLKTLYAKLQQLSPASIVTAVLFDKDGVVKHFQPDIVFARVPKRYWIGSGLDDGKGYGRELPGLWEVCNLPR